MEKIELKVDKNLLEIMKIARRIIENREEKYICIAFNRVTDRPWSEGDIKKDYPKFYNWIMHHGRILNNSDIKNKRIRYDGSKPYYWNKRWLSNEAMSHDHVDNFRFSNNRRIRIELLDKFIKRLEKERK